METNRLHLFRHQELFFYRPTCKDVRGLNLQPRMTKSAPPAVALFGPVLGARTRTEAGHPATLCWSGHSRHWQGSKP
jgi:hypothetical protein